VLGKVRARQGQRDGMVSEPMPRLAGIVVQLRICRWAADQRRRWNWLGVNLRGRDVAAKMGEERRNADVQQARNACRSQP
jgi:hypothetical protein